MCPGLDFCVMHPSIAPHTPKSDPDTLIQEQTAEAKEGKEVKLAQEPRLQVIKEGWLNKQSKKLKSSAPSASPHLAAPLDLAQPVALGSVTN